MTSIGERGNGRVKICPVSASHHTKRLNTRVLEDGGEGGRGQQRTVPRIQIKDLLTSDRSRPAGDGRLVKSGEYKGLTWEQVWRQQAGLMPPTTSRRSHSRSRNLSPSRSHSHSRSRSRSSSRRSVSASRPPPNSPLLWLQIYCRHLALPLIGPEVGAAAKTVGQAADAAGGEALTNS
eukprot:COSAG05_NODE_1694_length_4265_cov_73.510312_3_plen_178_part_00